MAGDDLYIYTSNQGYSSLDPIHLSCPYFDSYGVVYHYRKVRNKWKLIHEIKSQDGPGNIIGSLHANAQGLFFISTNINAESYENEVLLNHYYNGQIDWQRRLE